MLQTVGSKRSIETIESTLRTATLDCLSGIAETPQKLEKHLRMSGLLFSCSSDDLFSTGWLAQLYSMSHMATKSRMTRTSM
jgi:hypothetical protein